MPKSRPADITLAEWYQAQRHWPDLPAAPVVVELQPSQVKAAAPCELRVRFRATASLPADAIVHFEFPHGWGKYMGRIYPWRGLVPRGRGVGPGMGLLVDVFGPNLDRWDQYLLCHNLDRFQLLTLVVPPRGLTAGEDFLLVIGAPPGSPVQAQKWAQRCVFACGVDLGDGRILPVRPQPSIEVTGGPAVHLRVRAPATVIADESFSVLVSAADAAYWNPSEDYDSRLVLHYEGELTGPAEVELGRGRATVRCRLARGVGWVSACDAKGGLAGQSDPIAAEFLTKGQCIYFGDLHGQVYDSIGAGTHEEYFRWARDVEGLDFCAPANHYGGRVKADHTAWQRCVEATNRFYEPGRFATLVAYEWGGGPGHRNVYFRGDAGSLVLPRALTQPTAETPGELVEQLCQQAQPFFLVPHHPNFCNPMDWSFRDDEHQRLVEICSQWGISEEGPEHSAKAALALGHRLGFVGGSDTHFGTPGRGGHGDGQLTGLTAVLAPRLTRDAVWDALYQRRCYAVFGERVLLDFSVEDVPMGAEKSVSPASPAMHHRRVTARIATRTPIETIEIIRGGEVLAQFVPGPLRYAEVDFEDATDLAKALLQPQEGHYPAFCYYYLRLCTAGGGRAWSSPVWFSLEGTGQVQ